MCRGPFRGPARVFDNEDAAVKALLDRNLLSTVLICQQAARSMLRAGVHRLLVMEDGRLAGLVTTTDLVRAVAAGKLVPGRRR